MFRRTFLQYCVAILGFFGFSTKIVSQEQKELETILIPTTKPQELYISPIFTIAGPLVFRAPNDDYVFINGRRKYKEEKKEDFTIEYRVHLYNNGHLSVLSLQERDEYINKGAKEVNWDEWRNIFPLGYSTASTKWLL